VQGQKHIRKQRELRYQKHRKRHYEEHNTVRTSKERAKSVENAVLMIGQEERSRERSEAITGRKMKNGMNATETG